MRLIFWGARSPAGIIASNVPPGPVRWSILLTSQKRYKICGMAAPPLLPVCRLGYWLVFNGVHPACYHGCSCRSPDRSPFKSRLPAYVATHNYFLPTFRGALYRSPIGHCPARLPKSSPGNNKQKTSDWATATLPQGVRAGRYREMKEAAN
jgi:hypothetical protein